jgi:hypothetical protein
MHIARNASGPHFGYYRTDMRCRMRERDGVSFAHQDSRIPVARRAFEPITGATEQAFVAAQRRVSLQVPSVWVSGPLVAQLSRSVSHLRRLVMYNIVWLVGAVVIVLFVLGYFGLR